MARGRPRRPDLTESWDDVDNSDFDSQIFTRHDEKKELGSQYLSSQSTQVGTDPSVSSDEDRLARSATPRSMKKSVRIAESEEAPLPASTMRTRAGRRRNVEPTEPQLIMPTSPNGAGAKISNAKLRAQTPHFRLNQRSFTSDAGNFRTIGGKARKAKQQRDEAEEFSIWRIASSILSWALDIARIAVTNPIVKHALALCLLISGVVLIRNQAYSIVNSALSPLCHVPGVAWFAPSFCPSYSYERIKGNAEFDKLVQAQDMFESILAESAQGAVLPLEMKRSEASIRDLRSVVKYSSIPSRNELVYEFGIFIDAARQASQDLSRFDTRVGSAVDRILSINRWTQQTLRSIESDESVAKSSLTNKINIFALFQPVALNRDVLNNQYVRHTAAVEEQVLALITEAQVLLNGLENLDGRLEVIADIAKRDDITVSENKEMLLAELWTWCGGNRNDKAKLDNQLQLLKDVVQYKRLAWAHVSGTVIKLQAIRDQLEDLRERMALPEIMDAQIPLEVHIENIDLGIERLEAQRAASRRRTDESIEWVVNADADSRRALDAPV